MAVAVDAAAGQAMACTTRALFWAMRRCRLVVWLLAASLLAAPAQARADEQAAGQPLIVFAAASLRDLLNGMLSQWQRDTGKTAVVSYAGTSALARQIERGAPADLFISADQQWMDYLHKQRAVVPASMGRLARNALVLVVPEGAEPGQPDRIADSQLDLVARLGDAGRLAMANPDHVPAGRYARQALESLGLYSGVRNRLTRSANVRLALTLVARAECPLGVVYASDAHAEPRVRILARFPAGSHTAIVYPVALTTRSRRADAAALLDWLVAPARSSLLQQHGFLEP